MIQMPSLIGKYASEELFGINGWRAAYLTVATSFS